MSGAPGPWHRSGSSVFSTDHGKRYRVATVRNHLFTAEANAANANLIAAAPELLKALQAVITIADRKTDEFDLAHAAIAKARGLT
jgi:hypothetical protein